MAFRHGRSSPSLGLLQLLLNLLGNLKHILLGYFGRRIKPHICALDSGTTPSGWFRTGVTGLRQRADLAGPALLAEARVQIHLRPEGHSSLGPSAQVPNVTHGLRCNAELCRETRRLSATRLPICLGAIDPDRLPRVQYA